MRYSLLILSTALFFCSCNSSEIEKENIQTINTNDIVMNDIVHDSLTTSQIEKIKKNTIGVCRSIPGKFRGDNRQF
jgi:hypothetical protein